MSAKSLDISKMSYTAFRQRQPTLETQLRNPTILHRSETTAVHRYARIVNSERLSYLCLIPLDCLIEVPILPLYDDIRSIVVSHAPLLRGKLILNGFEATQHKKT